MKKSNKVSLAQRALNKIQDSEFMQLMQETKKTLKQTSQLSIEESFNDREETIEDYMFSCGYTRKQAINAYNKTIENER